MKAVRYEDLHYIDGNNNASELISAKASELDQVIGGIRGPGDTAALAYLASVHRWAVDQGMFRPAIGQALAQIRTQLIQLDGLPARDFLSAITSGLPH